MNSVKKFLKRFSVVLATAALTVGFGLWTVKAQGPRREATPQVYIGSTSPGWAIPGSIWWELTGSNTSTNYLIATNTAGTLFRTNVVPATFVNTGLTIRVQLGNATTSIWSTVTTTNGFTVSGIGTSVQ